MKVKKRRGAPIFALVTISVCLLILVGLFLLNHWRVELRMSAPAEQTLEVGSFYTLPEPTAVLRGDFLLRDGKALEVRRDGEVDTEHLGDYTVRYHAEGLLEEADASLTIHVVDTTPPVLTLVPDAFEYLLPNEVYVEAGFTATDNLDGDLTARVLREVREDGVYYAVSDSSGNRTEAFRPLVRDDPIPPELTLLGEQTMTLRVGGAYEEPGWAASDNVDGDLTEQVEITGEVNIWQAGTYTLRYAVEDGWGNRTEAERTVTVEKAPQPDPSDPGSKIIYLTFDDGPSKHTERLLEVLDKYGVKATFFVVNYGYKEMIAKEAAAGHSVGVHSLTHDYDKIYASEEAYFADLQAMNEIIKAQTGSYSTLIRFPGGSSNKVSLFNPGIMTRLVQAVTDAGYQYYDWNVSSGDAGLTTDTDVVYQNVIDGVSSRNVSIVLQHDSKGYSVDAVERIIQWGLANGYTFLPLTPSSPKAHHRLNN
ncbi:MAG: polysaccharide deacetylase family protein [Oscillospiraceae bacterium]|nr:polysaccharide deacetylase family protein [Oscillospiraceae bacterium]